MTDRLDEIKARHEYGYLRSEHTTEHADRAWLIGEVLRLREALAEITELVESRPSYCIHSFLYDGCPSCTLGAIHRTLAAVAAASDGERHDD